jgi:hypothetical protein
MDKTFAIEGTNTKVCITEHQEVIVYEGKSWDGDFWVTKKELLEVYPHLKNQLKDING